MSVQVSARVWKSTNAKGAALTVLLALADWADDVHASCYPGLEEIARKARLSRQAVVTALGHLKKLGEIEVVTRGHRSTSGDSRRDRNLYRVLTPTKGNSNWVKELDSSQNNCVNSNERLSQVLGVNRVNDVDSIDPVSLNDPSVDPSVDPSGVEPNNGSASPPAVLSFPTIGAGASTWQLTAEQLSEWQSVYPALDVLWECRRARAWVEAQPARRKTARGMPRFLVAWLNRAVDRSVGRANGPPRASGRTGAAAPGKYAGVMEGI